MTEEFVWEGAVMIVRGAHEGWGGDRHVKN